LLLGNYKILGVFNEIVIVLLLILANRVFALSEVTIISCDRICLQLFANPGNQKAYTALKLVNT